MSILLKYAHAICDKFENLLDHHDISIPDPNRQGDEDEARLYGDTYSELMDDVELLLLDLCVEFATHVNKSPMLFDAGDELNFVERILIRAERSDSK